MDPTFNIHWELNGKPLGAEELRSAFFAGKNPISSSDGYPIDPKNNVNNYSPAYQKLFENVMITSVAYNGENAGAYAIQASLSSDNVPWLYYSEVTKLVAQPKNSHPIIGWIFPKELGLSWQLAAPIQMNFSTNLTSPLLTFHYKGDLNTPYFLVSSNFILPAGSYAINIDGKILQGGMFIGLEDSNGGPWIKHAIYRDFQFKNNIARKSMLVAFSITQPESLRIILGNYSYLHGETTVWAIPRITLSRA